MHDHQWPMCADEFIATMNMGGQQHRAPYDMGKPPRSTIHYTHNDSVSKAFVIYNHEEEYTCFSRFISEDFKWLCRFYGPDDVYERYNKRRFYTEFQKGATKFVPKLKVLHMVV